MSKWPIVPLGELLTPVSRPQNVQPDAAYRILGAHWYAEGLYTKEIKPGSQIQANKVYRVEEGDFVYNRLFAWKGSFAIATRDNHNCYISNEFPCFSVRLDRADGQYLRKYFSRTSVWDDALGLSTGGTPTSRNRLKEEKLLAMAIPLPPLSEQRRIVARIESLAAKIEEASRLRGQAVNETEVLSIRAGSQTLDSPKWNCERLECVLAESPRNGLSPQQESESDGRPMLRINAVSSAPTRFVDLSAYKNVEVADDVAAPFVLQHNDVFIVRYNGDINRVAKAAIFKGKSNAGVVYPDKLMRLRTDQKNMLPDFLVLALGSMRVREQIEALGKTTAGQIGVSGGDAKDFVIPVPPIEEQRRIVAYLDGLQSKVDALKKLQSETTAELAALLPSILDKAFKGEL